MTNSETDQRGETGTPADEGRSVQRQQEHGKDALKEAADNSKALFIQKPQQVIGPRTEKAVADKGPNDASAQRSPPTFLLSKRRDVAAAKRFFSGRLNLECSFDQEPSARLSFSLAKEFKIVFVQSEAEPFPLQSEVRYPRSVVESQVPAGTHRSCTIA